MSHVTADSREAGRQHRERMARRSREQTESVSDIGELPPVAEPERRQACRHDLHLFLTTYFPASTGLKPFSADHRLVIGSMQDCILHGGRHVNGVYRGFAKTTTCENASIWATGYGHRRFVPIFGADQSSADSIIDSIKRELETNDLLAADFPEICYPIRCLEGKAQRQHSQTYDGELTRIRWTADTIVLPTILGSVASGAILCAHGLTGSNRGMKYKRADGTQQRPDMVIIDDPQTDESAHSPLQIRKRLDTIKKTILRLGGHNKTIACVINGTVIMVDDLMDQLLDPARNPAWRSLRISMVKSWAMAHDTLWLKEYAERRNTYNQDDPESQREAHRLANAYYLDNREAMDAGCQVSWEHCYDEETEHSAIQHAYNVLIDDGEDVVASELQNRPLRESTATTVLTETEIERKTNSYARGQVPIDAHKLTAFIDVQKDVLFWMLAAWGDGFTGYIIDYGAWPEQKRLRYTLREIRPRLCDKYPATGLEAWLYAGLNGLIAELFERRLYRDDGTEMRLSGAASCGIDANWGESTDTVYKVIRESAYRASLLACHGRFVGAVSPPLNSASRKAGELRGLNWRVPPLDGGRQTRHLVYDTNFWKSFLFKRLATPLGASGCVTLFAAGSRQTHSLLAEHLTAETPVTVTAKERTVDQWQLRPSRPDNHWLDTAVGCTVLASVHGVSLRVAAGDGKTTRRIKRRRATVTY